MVQPGAGKVAAAYQWNTVLTVPQMNQLLSMGIASGPAGQPMPAPRPTPQPTPLPGSGSAQATIITSTMPFKRSGHGVITLEASNATCDLTDGAFLDHGPVLHRHEPRMELVDNTPTFPNGKPDMCVPKTFLNEMSCTMQNMY